MPSEEKMQNPYPNATAAEVREWQAATDPATAAARNIMVRHIDGLFRRPYLRGDCDHAPILQGVRELVEPMMVLCAKIDAANSAGRLDGGGLDEIIDANAEVMAILEDHGCPS